MFWIAHALCLLFFIPGLVITIPLHMIFGAVSDVAKKIDKPQQPTGPSLPQYRRNKAGHLERIN